MTFRILISCNNSEFPRLAESPVLAGFLMWPGTAKKMEVHHEEVKTHPTLYQKSGGLHQSGAVVIEPVTDCHQLERDDLCHKCEGSGRLWGVETVNPSERERDLGDCPRCGGQGYEPEYNGEEE